LAVTTVIAPSATDPADLVGDARHSGGHHHNAPARQTDRDVRLAGRMEPGDLFRHAVFVIML
jgi:hypothetical protein